MWSNINAKLCVGLIYLVLMVLPSGGCANSQHQEHSVQDAKTDTGPVISYDTMFYKVGPQQAVPPDGKFEAGTRLEVIQEAGSYTLVRAEDGREGYVFSDAISQSCGNQ